MELRDYLRLLTRRWRTILVVLVACLIGTTVVTVLQPPSYRATASILVSVPQGAVSTGAALASGATSNLPALVGSFGALAGSPQSVQAAVARAGVASGNGVSISATGQEDVGLLAVAAVAPTAATAQAVANAFAETFPDVLVELNQLGSRDVLDFTTLQPAALPTATYRPNPVVNTAIGLALGLLLGIGMAVAREALDRRIRDSRGIEDRVGVSVLGVVPNELGREGLPAASHPDSARTESYRKIRTGLLFSGPDGLPRSIAVTSALAGEGKSSLAANLAVICAQAGQRVALVDADMRKPTVHTKLGVRNDVGLSSVLAGDVVLEVALQTARTGVTVLTSGPIPRDPSAMLESPELRKVLTELESTHDVVLIDTTPLLAVSDAAQVCSASEGAVVVSQLRRTTYESVIKAKTTLERVRTPVLGVVAVGRDEDPDAGYQYYYAAASETPPPTTARRSRAAAGGGSHRKGGDAEGATQSWRRRGTSG